MLDPDPDALDPRRRRLLFRATHRGTHENDLMIGGFVRAHLVEFSPAELEALEALLEQPETDLADWLTGRRSLPPDSPPMLRRIRASVVAAAPSLAGPTPASGPGLPLSANGVIPGSSPWTGPSHAGTRPPHSDSGEVPA